MNKFCLLAAVMVTIAGCANTGTDASATGTKERVADAYRPTGTLIPRKKSESNSVNTTEVNKQALENDRMTSPVNIPTGGR